MIKRKHANELAALRRLALEDVLQASEADLREQAEEEGLDFNELAEKIRSSMRVVICGRSLRKGQNYFSNQFTACDCNSI